MLIMKVPMILLVLNVINILHVASFRQWMHTLHVSKSHWGTFSPTFLRTRPSSSAAAGWRLQRPDAVERRTDEPGI
jgi:hypothetical protein